MNNTTYLINTIKELLQNVKLKDNNDLISNSFIRNINTDLVSIKDQIQDLIEWNNTRNTNIQKNMEDKISDYNYQKRVLSVFMPYMVFYGVSTLGIAEDRHIVCPQCSKKFIGKDFYKRCLQHCKDKHMRISDLKKECTVYDTDDAEKYTILE